MNTMVIILGVSLVNPSDSFIEYAQTISKIPARISTIQAIQPSSFLYKNQAVLTIFPVNSDTQFTREGVPPRYKNFIKPRCSNLVMVDVENAKSEIVLIIGQFIHNNYMRMDSEY